MFKLFHLVVGEDLYRHSLLSNPIDLSIKYLKWTRIEHRLSQFADDTSLILDGSEKSLNEALLELDWYAKLSGLNINFTKTQVVWIGSKKYSNDTLGQHRNLSWGKISFKLLGINFKIDLDKIVNINYNERILQIKKLIKIWSKRTACNLLIRPYSYVYKIKTNMNALPKLYSTDLIHMFRLTYTRTACKCTLLQWKMSAFCFLF